MPAAVLAVLYGVYRVVVELIDGTATAGGLVGLAFAPCPAGIVGSGSINGHTKEDT